MLFISVLLMCPAFAQNASLRLKYWRCCIQDVDYLAKAVEINPGRVQQIVNDMVPKVLREMDATDPDDPTWVMSDIS